MSEGIIYTCKRCGEDMSGESLEFRGGEIKCILCGFRVLTKNRPPYVKRIKAV